MGEIMNKTKHFYCHLCFNSSLFFGLLCLYAACQSDNKRQAVRHVAPAFYYWRSVYRADSLEMSYQTTLNAQKLYLKFFDVAWNSHTKDAMPIAALQFADPPPASLNIVPTVFVTNQTLVQLPDTLIDTLATRIGRRLRAMIQQNNLANRIVEIQFDCDWSGATKEKYFALLKKFGELPDFKAIPLSATIRLHQIKYAQKTGVPPVKRGMLMCYNMGELREPKTINSILDIATLKSYIGNLGQYPLPLDIGLPLFSWGVLFRNKQFEGLINGLCLADMDSIVPKKAISPNAFLIEKPFYLGDIPLQTKDLLRIEEVNTDLLTETVAILRKKLNNDTINVIFYHLDKTLLSHYKTIDLQTICAQLTY